MNEKIDRKMSLDQAKDSLNMIKDKLDSNQKHKELLGANDVTGIEQLARVGMIMLKEVEESRMILKMIEIKKIIAELENKNTHAEKIEMLKNNPFSLVFKEDELKNKYMKAYENKVVAKNGRALEPDEIIDVEVIESEPYKISNDMKSRLLEKIKDGSLNKEDTQKLIEYKIIDEKDIEDLEKDELDNEDFEEITIETEIQDKNSNINYTVSQESSLGYPMAKKDFTKEQLSNEVDTAMNSKDFEPNEALKHYENKTGKKVSFDELVSESNNSNVVAMESIMNGAYKDIKIEQTKKVDYFDQRTATEDVANNSNKSTNLRRM